MNPLLPMVRLLRHAELAHCRVTKWKLTQLYAWKLADFLAWTTDGKKMPGEIFAEMFLGETRLLGAAVQVERT